MDHYEPWTAEQALALLAWIKSYDQRVSMGPTDEEALLKAAAYAKALDYDGVDYEWARQFVTRHYRQERLEVLQVGVIIQRWRLEEHIELAGGSIALLDSPDAPWWFRQFALDCMKVSKEAAAAHAHLGGARCRRKVREAIAALPDPEGYHPPGGPPSEAEQVERHCGEAVCACTHTVCRRGWLDEEYITFRRGTDTGSEYHSVKRCDYCLDATKMRGERV